MNEQDIDTIHRYLSGTLDAAERETFEARLQSDPDLQDALELERVLLAGIVYAGQKELRQTIGEVHQSLKKEQFFEATEANSDGSKPLKIFEMKRILAVAATLVVLVGGVWFFMNQTASEVNTQALYKQFYQPENDRQRAQEVIASLESYGLAGVPSENDTLKMALELYNDGKYAAALDYLKVFSEKHPENDMARYYIGVIHMSQERYAKAIEVLLPISRSDVSALKNDALWNLALCYLRTENGQPDAEAAFQTLAADNSYNNHRGAKAVLEQLLPK